VEGTPTPTSAILGWTPKALQQVVTGMQTPSDPIHEWELWRFYAAAMLHADAVIEWAAPNGDRDIPSVAREQLLTASSILAKGGKHVAPFAAVWYEATARWLRLHNRFDLATEVLNHGRQWLPAEVRVLYESGVTAELLGAVYLRQSRSFQPNRSWRPMRDPLGPGERLARGTLADAESFLRTTIELDPEHNLARLRLAHVLLLRDDIDDAIKLTDDVSTRALDPPVTYLANLMGGAAFERRGDLTTAAARYRAAIDHFDRGQSAYVALSHVLYGQGKYDESRKILRTMIDSPHREEKLFEPWWLFVTDIAPAVDQLFLTLRELAKR
jgi:tetratricopeptide (TPR) repeat protein